MLRLPVTRLNLNNARTCVLIVLAVACFGWGLYAAFDALRGEQSVFVHMGAGSSVARRFQIAESFAHEARGRDVFVEVVPTNGFEDSIHQVSEGKLDLAAVSSGLRSAEAKNVQVLAGLDIAPLHILVRRELVEKNLSLLEMIKGRRVNLGQPGTNDYILASDVVRFLRLKAFATFGEGDYTELNLSKDDLGALAHEVQSQTGAARDERLRELPDVVMTVGSLPGLLTQSLLDTGEYRLVPFPYVEPLMMSNLQQGDDDGEGKVDRLLIEPVTIHRGMYLGDSPMPAADCTTIGLRTLLVARKDLPKATVNRVMQCVFETDFKRRVKPRSPREIATAFKTHPGAEAYLDRDKPLITSSLCNAASQFLSIFGAFSAGALSIYGYLRRRRIRRPGEYLEEIREIDAMASGQRPEGVESVSAAELAQRLDLRLTQLKERVIHDYCSNRVQGEMVLLSVLSILADSRTQLRGSPGRHANVEVGANPYAKPAWPTSSITVPSIERKPGLAA